MLFLLLAVIVGLGGVVVLNIVGDVSLESLPQVPTAAVIAGALIALYFASHYGTRREGRTKLILTLCVATIAALSLAQFRDRAPLSIASLIASLPQLPQPPVAQPLRSDTPASVRIRRTADGSFRAHAELNGSDVTMLVDTGSGAIVLRASDAEKSGIETKNLAYDTPLTTANGATYVAAVRLKTLRVGALEMQDIEALVAKPGTLKESLLGMAFLRGLASYEVAGDFVTLRQ